MSAASAFPHDPDALRALSGDLRQLASVRRIVLDEGAERGVRALAFSSGGGLDFWALSDRALDIGPLWWRGTPLAWQHPGGFSAPALHGADADNGTGIERSLSGFLVTCGLANARQPRAGYPLHGSLPLRPARVTLCRERWDVPIPRLEAEGEIVDAHLSRHAFRLHRRIEVPIGGCELTLHDRVENIGPSSAAMMILYHTNLGYPCIDTEARVTVDGREIHREETLADGVGTSSSIDCHRLGGDGRSAIELTGGASSVPVLVDADVRSLPYLQIWRDTRPGRNVLAIEPGNCARAEDGKSLPGRPLEPGESWSTRLRYRFGSP